MSLFSKIIFFFKKPKVVIVTGKGSSCATEAIFQVLKQYHKVKKLTKNQRFLKFWQILGLHPPSARGARVEREGGGGVGVPLWRAPEIFIFESEIENPEDFKFFAEKSRLSILVVTHIGEIPPDKNFFAGEEKDIRQIRRLVKILPPNSNLILNFDDETVRAIGDFIDLKSLTIGFQEGANFQATDVKLNTGTNFKLNYEKNVVPIWLDFLFGKEQIYSALAAIAVGTVLGLNLIEISQALKKYHSLPGKMRLIKGVKNSLILDDSQGATAFSMIEALEILRKIDMRAPALGNLISKTSGGKKIAVLGDILGIGKYTIEAHESIGEKVVESADLLFTVGARAKFIAQGAISKGMSEEKIFQFDEIKEAGIALQKEIEEGDLILVDGSTEMEMAKIVEETRALP